MTNLIKITTNEQKEQLVSARELHEFLEVKTPYKKWFDRMCEYGFIENIDFVTVGQKCPIANGGYQESTNHVIKLDMAKEISMIQRTDKGKQARRYFIECEKKLKEKVAPALTKKEELILKLYNSTGAESLKLSNELTEIEVAAQTKELRLGHFKAINATEMVEKINVKGLTTQLLNEWWAETGFGTYDRVGKKREFTPNERFIKWVVEEGFARTKKNLKKDKVTIIYNSCIVDRFNKKHLVELEKFVAKRTIKF